YLKESTKHHEREIARKERSKKAKEQAKRRKERKKSGKPAGIPQTLETLRTPDETILPKDDADVIKEEEHVCKFAYSLIVRTNLRKFTQMNHLPNGPTATFRVSNVTPRRKIHGLKNRGIEPGVVPHLLLNRFMTRLGRRVERILGALFPAASRGPPQPHCRTVVFHNQRDFIFFRHYRYQHKKDRLGQEEEPETTNTPATGLNDRVVTNEVGPRFTLKLRSIQVGTFDSQFGDFEWVRKSAVTGKSRRTFVL
ncbi:unnamed protein product, partial [Dibothriocephalus latus]